MANENKKLTQVETAEELKALAKENGVELTDEQAAEVLAKLKSGELSEDELNAVSGGSISSTILEMTRKILEDLRRSMENLK